MDEEGYSIRPQDAAAIRGFPDDDANQDSDDSDFEDGKYGMCCGMCYCDSGTCI